MTKNRKQAQTKRIVAEMLRENTGRSMLDSGGTPQYNEKGQYVGSLNGYGRAFERNQGVNFDAQPAAWLNVYGGSKPYFYVTVSLYHWMTEHLTYDGRLQNRLNRFAARPENEKESWLSIIQQFPLYLREKGEHVTGLYGDEGASFNATYTYNEETPLSQDIQFVYFEMDGTPYVALQVHNGCDARGGLTAPKVFEVDEASTVYNYNDLSLVAHRPDVEDPNQLIIPQCRPIMETLPRVVYWDTDDGSHFYPSMDNPGEPRKRLDEYPVSEDLNDRGKGYLVFDEENGALYCPLTGWKLEPYTR